MPFKCLGRIQGLLGEVAEQEADPMAAAMDLLETCVRDKGSIWVFGASHAGILAEELFYRAGGLMLVNPIFGRELMLDTQQVTHTSQMERLVGYGTDLAKSKASFKPGDVLITHSVSGRNPVTVEMAVAAREAGAKVIALTNLAYSRTVTSRHPSGLRLFEVADVVIDNHGDVGDACVPIDGLDQKVSPSSTVVGAAVLNSIVAALVQRLVDGGMTTPPVFYSANIDGGDDLNRALFEEYKGSIHYAY